MDENLSTLTYASKASFIDNKPIKNEDPKTQQIADLKRQVKILTEELANANETINFLSSLTGKDPASIKNNLNSAMRGQGRGGSLNDGAGGDICSHCNGSGSAAQGPD